MSIGVPFAPTSIAIVSPLGYLVTAYTDRYAFELHRPGQPILSIRREVAPTPVTSHERDSARAAITDRMRRTNPRWSWPSADIPRNRPAFASLAVGLDGRIWAPLVPEIAGVAGSVPGGGSVGGGRGTSPRVADVTNEPSPSRPAPYDVFEPDGRYLGQVRIPPRVSTIARRGDTVWAVAYDEDDVATVRRYRIVWR